MNSIPKGGNFPKNPTTTEASSTSKVTQPVSGQGEPTEILQTPLKAPAVEPPATLQLNPDLNLSEASIKRNLQSSSGSSSSSSSSSGISTKPSMNLAVGSGRKGLNISAAQAGGDHQQLVAFIQKEIFKLEKENIQLFTPEFDYNLKDLDLSSAINQVMGERFPGAEITIDSIGQGNFGAKLVSVTTINDETSETHITRYVIKPATIPKDLFQKRSDEVIRNLEKSGGLTVYERLKRGIKISRQRDEITPEAIKALFIDNPDRLFNQKFPHVSAVQREILAYAVSDFFDGDVPAVQSLFCSEGGFSLHHFVDSATDLTVHQSSSDVGSGYDVDSVQRMGVMDILLGNTDRNPGNLMVLKTSSGRSKLIPIDHAQVLQRDKDKISPENIVEPVWMAFKESREPLSKKIKEQIMDFHEESLAKSAHAKGITLHLRSEELAMMKTNLQLVKDAITDHPDISLRELGELYYFGNSLEQVSSVEDTTLDTQPKFKGPPTPGGYWDENPFEDP